MAVGVCLATRPVGSTLETETLGELRSPQEEWRSRCRCTSLKRYEEATGEQIHHTNHAQCGRVCRSGLAFAERRKRGFPESARMSSNGIRSLRRARFGHGKQCDELVVGLSGCARGVRYFSAGLAARESSGRRRRVGDLAGVVAERRREWGMPTGSVGVGGGSSAARLSSSNRYLSFIFSLSATDPSPVRPLPTAVLPTLVALSGSQAIPDLLLSISTLSCDVPFAFF
ncbi:hypothetical protein C8Q79DRAFT_490246 [Trametes meyenii]|nr:hypothetical protein C8Q79DRAFT_490246 [Trametes meyenii]